MPDLPSAAVERGAKAINAYGMHGLPDSGYGRRDISRAVLTAAHDELIQAWIRSCLDDPETVDRVAWPIWVAITMQPWMGRYPSDDEPVDMMKPITKNQVRNVARAAIRALLGAEDE